MQMNAHTRLDIVHCLCNHTDLTISSLKLRECVAFLLKIYSPFVIFVNEVVFQFNLYQIWKNEIDCAKKKGKIFNKNS